MNALGGMIVMGGIGSMLFGPIGLAVGVVVGCMMGLEQSRQEREKRDRS